MFVGRERELEVLNRLAGRGQFQMVVVYGRRRVGKTALIAQFCKGRRALAFTAQEQSSRDNLREFSRTIYRFFDAPETSGPFATWMDAFRYIADQAKSRPAQPFVMVFDEFPYAAATEKSLPSTLQIAIDHEFKSTNMIMILCGSNEGFMESDVLGRKSPLYGRRNAQIRLLPFDVFDAAAMMPSGTGWEDVIKYYSVLGGTPYYLEQIDPELSFADNIAELCFSTSGILYEEPMMLMREELREPAMYHSILSAIGAGQTRPKDIAEQSGLDPSSIGSYLSTLRALGLIERIVPFGDAPEHSRKGLWKIKDPFFAYWYRFVRRNAALIEIGNGTAAVPMATAGGVFSTYVGKQFEAISLQWVLRQCREGRLDMMPTSFGTWWGNDPKRREQADIDVVVEDSYAHRMLLGECKWRGDFDESEAMGKLEERAALIGGRDERQYMLFTKLPVGAATVRKASPQWRFVDAASMLRD